MARVVGVSVYYVIYIVTDCLPLCFWPLAIPLTLGRNTTPSRDPGGTHYTRLVLTACEINRSCILELVSCWMVCHLYFGLHEGSLTVEAARRLM